MDSGIGSGFGLGPTEPVGDTSGAHDESLPRARESAAEGEPRRRRKEPEEISANHSDEETPETAEGADIGGVAGPASAGNKGEDNTGENNTGEDQPPPHRIDSLA
jgi:hypothetical protein